MIKVIREPKTATHRHKVANKYIRLGVDDTIEVYNDGFWERSYTITQDDVFISHSKMYTTLKKTGIDKMICNLYLFSVRSLYRV